MRSSSDMREPFVASAESSSFDAVVIGHFARDEIVVDGLMERASGGGVYYGAVALTRLGRRVGAITRLHPRDFPLLDAMTREGIAVHAQAGPETSGIENIYDSKDMERRVCRPMGFAGAFDPEDLPNWTGRMIVASPIIAGEIDLDLMKGLSRQGPLALDVQGFVRVREADSLVFRPWPDMREGLALVTWLKVDRAEAELLTGQTEARDAVRALAQFGPSEILMTESSGLTVWADGQIYQAAFRPRSLAGRTGRGDTCFASYLGLRLSEPAERATAIAAAITSIKQETPGPWRGDLDQALARMGSWESMSGSR